MAAAKKKPKGKGKSNTVPKTAEQKGAEAALQQSQRIALEAQRQRTSQSSKGAFRARELRAGGTSLGQYDLARFKSDPFPALGGGGSSGMPTGAPGPASSGGTQGGKGRSNGGGATPAGKARAKAQAKAKAENRLKTNMNGVNNAEKMEAQAAAKAKAKAAAAAAAAKAKKKKQQKLTDSKGGVTKALGTKPVMS